MWKMIYHRLAWSLFLMLSLCQALTTLPTQQRTIFFGSALIERPNRDDIVSPARITMRKQKAGDRRTRRRQRGETASELAPVVATVTTNPMMGAVWKSKSMIAGSPRTNVATPATTGGRGRSRKRTTLYQTLQHYHSSFLTPLSAEYEAEVSGQQRTVACFLAKLCS